MPAPERIWLQDDGDVSLPHGCYACGMATEPYDGKCIEYIRLDVAVRMMREASEETVKQALRFIR